MKLYNIETGLIDDDFVRGRITLRVFTEKNPTVPIPCRLYDTGRVVGIVQNRNGDWTEYVPAPDFTKAVLTWINVHRSDLHKKQTSLFT